MWCWPLTLWVNLCFYNVHTVCITANRLYSKLPWPYVLIGKKGMDATMTMKCMKGIIKAHHKEAATQISNAKKFSAKRSCSPFPCCLRN
ncbi:hypothetical protein R1flu_003705 [Riccia fluitans]|uniref:Secreted protein n=1 Tax=Riccia fluitans TaxID=41844 RepID=A0ABD1Y9W0_9MARC